MCHTHININKIYKNELLRISLNALQSGIKTTSHVCSDCDAI